MINNHKEEGLTRRLQALTTQDFLNVGIDHIVYIRPNNSGMNMTYDIFAADGTPLAEQKSWETAAALARQNNLEPVMVH